MIEAEDKSVNQLEIQKQTGGDSQPVLGQLFMPMLACYTSDTTYFSGLNLQVYRPLFTFLSGKICVWYLGKFENVLLQRLLILFLMVSYYTQLRKCPSVHSVRTFCLFFLKLYVFVCIFSSHCLLQDTNLLESISGLATSFSQIIFHSLLICQDVLKISCSVAVSPFPGCLRCLSEHLSPLSEVMLNSWKLCDSNFTAPVTFSTHGFHILTFFLSSSSFSCSYPFPIFHSH